MKKHHTLTINILKAYSLLTQLIKEVDIIIFTNVDCCKETSLTVKKTIYYLSVSIDILENYKILVSSITRDEALHTTSVLGANLKNQIGNVSLEDIFDCTNIINDFDSFDIDDFGITLLDFMKKNLKYYEELDLLINEYKNKISNQQELEEITMIQKNIYKTIHIISYLWLDILIRYDIYCKHFNSL